MYVSTLYVSTLYISVARSFSRQGPLKMICICIIFGSLLSWGKLPLKIADGQARNAMQRTVWHSALCGTRHSVPRYKLVDMLFLSIDKSVKIVVELVKC